MTDSTETAVAVLKSEVRNLTKSLDDHKVTSAAAANKADEKIDEVSDAVAALGKTLSDFMVKISIGTGIFCALFVIIFAIPKLSEILKLITN